ncbi:hypothetical protein MTP99_016145 [Tenebrio molitor]|jgi:hypothetical protein|nr:hypothetical protein MTP99_016145 [Tenebrio molitor]
MGFSSNGREPLPRKRFSQWQVDAKRTHSRFDSDNYRLDPAGFVAANYFTTMREGQILKKALDLGDNKRRSLSRESRETMANYCCSRPWAAKRPQWY